MRKEEGYGYLPSIAWIEDEIYAMRLKGFFLIGIVECGVGQEEEIKSAIQVNCVQVVGYRFYFRV